MYAAQAELLLLNVQMLDLLEERSQHKDGHMCLTSLTLNPFIFANAGHPIKKLPIEFSYQSFNAGLILTTKLILEKYIHTLSGKYERLGSASSVFVSVFHSKLEYEYEK
uniref:Uncharacterized protein n=1 Tax=Glossina pallidipes TaxID=7398 RepID=A0A1A9ZIG9_GLOPL